MCLGILLEFSAMRMKRSKMSRKKSKRDFSRKAGAHRKNYSRGSAMRGGIRL